MGYYIYGKAVDTNQLFNTLGSKDENLYQKTVNQLNNNYSDVAPKELTIQQAIYTIMFGENGKPEYDYMYGYAFIEICNILGKDIPCQQELKLGYDTDLVNKYLKQDYNIDLTIEDFLFSDMIIPNHIEIKEWPMIATLKNEDLQELANILSPINISDEIIKELWDGDDDDDEDKACAYEAIVGLKQNLNFCLENKLDLALFCH